MVRAGVAAAFNKAGIIKKENLAGSAGHNFHRCFTEGEKEKMPKDILPGQDVYKRQVQDNCRPLYEKIDSKLGWKYPRALMTRLQGKMTVSELKKMAGEMMTGEVLYPEKPPKLLPDVENPIYMAQQKGTATHKIFELLPFGEMISKEDVSSFIHRCVERCV